MSISNRIRDYLEKNPQLYERIYKRIRRTGIDIIQGITPFTALLTRYGINQVFDIGANEGQYAQRIRRVGYTGEIISFEPVCNVYKNLTQNAAKDSLWTAINMGCGDYDGEAIINISANTKFSSMLPQTSVLETEYITETKYVDKETIKVCTIDSIFNKYYTHGKRVLLKIDTQGFEKNVLEGSLKSLKDIIAIQLELSFRAHYEGEWLIKDMLDYMFTKGFTLVALEPLQNNFKKKKLLQGDGFFFRLDRV